MVIFKALGEIERGDREPGVFSRAPVTNYHRMGGLNYKNYFFSQYLGPEVQDQGMGRVGLF